MDVIIITNAYPYGAGEQFLENELRYWRDASACRVTVVPTYTHGRARHMYPGISLDDRWAPSAKWYFVSRLPLVFFSRFLYAELLSLAKRRKVDIRNVLTAFVSLSKVFWWRDRFAKLLRRRSDECVLYAYWNDVPSYGAALVRSQGMARKAVSRAHRYDLYEECRPNRYMPYKWQFVPYFDAVYALSPEGKAYINENYAPLPEVVRTSPLGVEVGAVLTRPSPEGCLVVVSAAFCVYNKRIDKIIDALRLISMKNTFLSIHWTHIGDGPLEKDLKKKAFQVLGEIQNIVYEFKGFVDNRKLKERYCETTIDILLNASESEGVPVSIMEAMSQGVPAVAPDVGGVSSLVSNDCGLLMSAAPSPEEIAESVVKVMHYAKSVATRQRAMETVRKNFNASINYPDFVDSISTL